MTTNRSKQTPHSTNSISCTASAKLEKSKRNHAVLVQWLETHCENPYPSKAEKYYLACYANMTQRQLNDWFANARRNIKKVGFNAWKTKHSSTMIGGRSRRQFSSTPEAHMFAGGINCKKMYHFSTCPLPSTTTANSQVTQNYVPTPTKSSFPLPIINKVSTPTHVDCTSSTSTALYTLYPSHTSSLCSCNYCAIPTTHTLCTVPVFSGFNSSFKSDRVTKYEVGACSSFTPLTHNSKSMMQTQVHFYKSSHEKQNVIPRLSLQAKLKNVQKPPETDTLRVCKGPSSVRSVNPLEQHFSSNSSCLTCSTSSESASVAIGYEHDVNKSTIPGQEICAMDHFMYNSRSETKPLFHLPESNLEHIVSSTTSSQSKPQLMWNAINSASTQLLKESELPVLLETPKDSNKENGIMDIQKRTNYSTSTAEC